MTKPSVYDFLPVIESQRGDRYVFGAETRFTDPNPSAFDCSELVQWGLARVGIANPPDGAANQWRWCSNAGLTLPVTQGIATFGALLFRIGVHGDHVAVSLGNGQTFEARGRAYGVNEFSAKGRVWTSAALIPGLDYGHRSIPQLRPGDEMLNDEERRLVQGIQDAVARIEAAIGTGTDGKGKARGPIGGVVARVDQRVGEQGLDLGAIKKKVGA